MQKMENVEEINLKINDQKIKEFFNMKNSENFIKSVIE